MIQTSLQEKEAELFPKGEDKAQREHEVGKIGVARALLKVDPVEMWFWSYVAAGG